MIKKNRGIRHKGTDCSRLANAFLCEKYERKKKNILQAFCLRKQFCCLLKDLADVRKGRLNLRHEFAFDLVHIGNNLMDFAQVRNLICDMTGIHQTKIFYARTNRAVHA